MIENPETTGVLIFSGQLLLDLAEAGMSREDAYRLVQKHAMAAWKNGNNFRDAARDDPEIRGKLSDRQLEHAFDLKRQLGNVEGIFKRVFSSRQGGDAEKSGSA